jgi:ribosomal RNA-processing protein 7
LHAAEPGAEPQEPPPADSCDACGLASWIAEHRAARPGLDVLQKQVDDWIAAHEKHEAEAAAAAAAAAAGDDGWTVVGAKRGRHKTTDGTISVGGVAPKLAAAKRAAKQPLEVHPDFYRFQKREKQRSEVLALREKFELDKARIAELRRQRAFKPS